jgi:hypothetical protein
LHPDQSVRLAAARRWLEEVDTGNWLLVLDNVFPETLDFLREHLPRQNGRGSVLFTTRRENVALALSSTAGERHEVIDVPLLDVKEGVELFLGHFDYGEIDGQPWEMEEIVMSVGCLPLAISHAAGYLKRSHGSLDDMLDLYRGKHKIDVSPDTQFCDSTMLTPLLEADQLGAYSVGVRAQICDCDIHVPTPRPRTTMP